MKNEIKEKKCIRCLQVLPIENFGIRNANKFKDGRNSYCKTCCIIKNRDAKARLGVGRAKPYQGIDESLYGEQAILERQRKEALEEYEAILNSPEGKEKKVCTKCGNELPLVYFYKSRRNKDGRKSECVHCSKAYYVKTGHLLPNNGERKESVRELELKKLMKSTIKEIKKRGGVKSPKSYGLLKGYQSLKREYDEILGNV